MTDKECSGRDVLKEALRQSDLTYCDEFPQSELEMTFDNNKFRKMERQIKRSQRHWGRFLLRIGKYAAVFILMVGVILGGTISVYGESKFTADLYAEPYFVNPSLMIYRFSYSTEGAPKKLEELFAPTYVPDGYILTEKKLSVYRRDLIYRYENEEGDCIIFEQMTISHGVGFDINKTVVEVLKIRDLDVVYAESDGLTTMFWGNYGYAFKISLYGKFAKEEAFQVFESIRKVREPI